ncbi:MULTISPECIES: hypothetical protein [unclassified Cryobacterium]|uniref:hypothetical protein n=1 Tax=unclassified Cryobacterium TaxID=2649013 RepID=UPI0018ED30AE|nr:MULTISPECIES: hypothetical protein [unclassified Cryobacterium]
MGGNDPIQVPGIERNPVVEAGTRARNDPERNRRDGGIHTEEMSQYLIGGPTPVTGFAEIGNGCRFEQLFIGASKGCCDHEVLPLRLVLSAGISALVTLDCFGDLGDPL